MSVLLTGSMAMAVPVPLAAAAGITDLQAEPALTSPSCDRIEPRLIETADHAVSGVARMRRVWPGYWAADRDIVIYEPGRSAVVIAALAPPAPFTAVPPDALPQALRGATYFACAALPGLTGNFDTSYPIGDRRAVAVRLEPGAYETLEVLFHEGFHEWQKTAFARTRGADSIPLQDEARGYLDVIRDPRFVASMELERRILAAAVVAPSPRERIELARQYLAVKSRRTAAMPVAARHTELNVERKEGSASIVGHEAAALAFGRKVDAPYVQLRSLMAEPPESLPAGDSAFARFRMRAFGAGAAIAWILSRDGVEWRKPLQDGASFETLLADAVRFDAAATDTLAAAAAERFGMTGLLRDAEAWRARSTELTEVDFYKARPLRLTIVFPGYGTSPPSYSVSHSGLPDVPEDGLLIFGDTRTAKLTYGPIELASEERPILVDQRRGPASYSFTLLMNELPQLTGFEGGAGGSVAAKGLTVKIGVGAVVEKSAREVTIRLKPG